MHLKKVVLETLKKNKQGKQCYIQQSSIQR